MSNKLRRFYLRKHDYYGGTLAVDHEGWDEHITLRFQAYSSGGCEMEIDLDELDLLRQAITDLIDNHPLHQPPLDPFVNGLDEEWRREEGLGTWTTVTEGEPL